MASFPNHPGVFNLNDPQQNPSSNRNPGVQSGEAIYQDAAAYPVYGMDGQIIYRPQPTYAPPLNTQYTTVPEIQYHNLAPASAADMSYAGYPPSGGLAIPSVLQVPPMENFQPPGRLQLPEYIGAEPFGPPIISSTIGLSTSAPTGGMGEWMSQRAPPTVGHASKPLPIAPGVVKKTRQQFSACTACRLRRVKCDLKDLRAEWEKLHRREGPIPTDPGPSKKEEEVTALQPEDPKKKGKLPAKVVEKPNLTAISRKEDIQCTNCFHREVKCIDEFAHRKTKRVRPMMPDPGVMDGQSDRSNDSFSSSQRGKVPGQGLPTAVPRSVFPAEEEFKHVGVSVDPSKHLRPGLPREWSGLSNASDPYSYSDTVFAPTFPAEALWTDEQQAPYQQPAAQAMVTAEPVTSTTIEQGISDPMVLEHSMDFLFASPNESTKDTTSSSFIDDINRVIASEPSDNSASTPRSHSSRGRSRGTSHSQHSTRSEFRIPDLKPSFFESDFYRRFHIQRPIIDPIDFKQRYFSNVPYSAAGMGPIGAILCHVLYAWASSYGIDESGEPTIMREGWHSPPATANSAHADNARRDREIARQRQLDQTNLAVKEILKEIDHAGIYRNMSWDGVRCMLLILPLTEYTSSPAERLVMYECALGQVFQLCSAAALDYDGLPQHLKPEDELIRRRLYWYAFVHEGITTGLKGGRMVLDEDDLSSLEETLPATTKLALASSKAYQSVAKFASAPIRLSIACRLVHKALTGARARRSEKVDRIRLNAAWEALEESWVEFDGIRRFPPGHIQDENIIRFADGWKIFMFEAHNVIRESLEHRLQSLERKGREAAQFEDLSIDSSWKTETQALHEIRNLRDIARAKCDQLVREIAGIIKQHLHTPFFEWDASLVRDGIFYVASLLAQSGGAEQDIACCAQALSEMRWAFAKSEERTERVLALCSQRPVQQGSGARRHTGGFEPRLIPDEVGKKPGFLYTAEHSVPSVSSFNTSNNDFFSAVAEQHMMEDEPPMPPNGQIRPEMPHNIYGMDSAMPSATSNTPLAFNPELYGQPPNITANTHPTQSSNAAKLSGWTDSSLTYLGPVQTPQYTERSAGPGSNIWGNPYPR